VLLEEHNQGVSENVPQFLFDEYGEKLDHITASRLWDIAEGVMLHAREGTRGPRLPSVFIKSVDHVHLLDFGLTVFPQPGGWQFCDFTYSVGVER
jgi:hypothetical protein